MTDRSALYPGVDWEPNRLCPVVRDGVDCRAERWVKVDVAHGEGEPPDAEPYDLYECTRCGMAFTDPIASEATVAALYADRSSRDFQPDDDAFTVRWRRALAVRDFRGMLRAAGADEPRAVLDYACGNGTWTTAIRAALPHAEVVAADFHDVPPPALADPAVRIGYSPIARLDEYAGRFDVVLLRHVMEHMHDPVGQLRDLRAVLRPGGTVLVEVPAWESPWRRWFGANWEFHYAPYHTLHYSAAGLASVLREGGFEDVATGWSDMPLMGRNLQNVLRRPYGLRMQALGALLQPVQTAVGRASGTATCLRAWARAPR